MAFLMPMKPRYSKAYYYHKRDRFRRLLEQYDAIPESCGFPNGPQRHVLRQLSRTSKNCIGLSYRLEHILNPWVNFCIMPIFALANAGVTIPSLEYFNITQFSPELGSVSMGVFLGLLLGKPLGITLASFLAVKTKVGAMPANASWKMLFAVACLGGIGFTMSIFVDTLSFGELLPEVTVRLRDMGKVAVLMGSVCAGLLGSGRTETAEMIFGACLQKKFISPAGPVCSLIWWPPEKKESSFSWATPRPLHSIRTTATNGVRILPGCISLGWMSRSTAPCWIWKAGNRPSLQTM